MGYSQSWVAVRGKGRATVLAAFGLRPTGAREEVAESPLVGAELPGGWYLLVANQGADALAGEAALAGISTAGEAVTCEVEEHVMVSVASGWRDGRRLWVVGHDAQRGLDHLDAEGALPETFSEMRDRARAAQHAAGGDADHFFDVPVELAKALTGYRHDEDPPGASDEPFEVLAAAAGGGPKSWLGRLFGR